MRTNLYVMLMSCASCLGYATAEDPAPELPWWHLYSTVATDPQEMSLEDIRTIGADSWRAAGWYAGWYGFWFVDMLEGHTDVPHRWQRVKDGGARPIMYYDAGEVGDFVALVDEENRRLLGYGWNWNASQGEDGTIVWFGLESFMNGAPWAPFPTARDHSLPPFTHPGGSPIAKGELYGVLSRRNLENDWQFDKFANPDISDEMAKKTGLAAFSTRQEGHPGVQQGTGWVIVRQAYVDFTNPQWLAYACRELQWSIGRIRPAGVHIDNFGSTRIWGTGDSFGAWTVHTYRQYLKRHFSPVRLAGLGVDDPDTFDIREYVASRYADEGLPGGKRLRDRRWLEDILFRSHLINKTEHAIRFWRALYAAGKTATQEAGLDGPVLGNLMPLLPGSELLAGHCDIAHFEWKTEGAYPGMPGLGLPPAARVAYVSRLGERISNASYCWPSLYVPQKYTGPKYVNLHKVLAFDALANRGIIDYNHWFLDSYSPGTDESAGYVNGFIRAIAPELSGREYVAGIALAYCPWSNIASIDGMGVNPELYLNEYKGWCDFLCNSHAQWDVILAADLTAAGLAKYQAVALPSMLVITQAQAKELASYLDGGGAIIATGETGVFDGPEGFLMPHTSGPLARLGGHPRLVRTKARPGARYFATQGGAEAHAEMQGLLARSGVSPTLTTDAPRSVGVNVSRRLQGGTASMTIDLNNHDYDLDTDTVAPAPPTRIATALVPELRGKELELLTARPGDSDEGYWKPLDDSLWRLDAAGEMLRLTAPEFTYFMTILIRERGADNEGMGAAREHYACPSRA